MFFFFEKAAKRQHHDTINAIANKISKGNPMKCLLIHQQYISNLLKCNSYFCQMCTHMHSSRSQCGKTFGDKCTKTRDNQLKKSQYRKAKTTHHITLFKSSPFLLINRNVGSYFAANQM